MPVLYTLSYKTFTELVCKPAPIVISDHTYFYDVTAVPRATPNRFLFRD